MIWYILSSSLKNIKKYDQFKKKKKKKKKATNLLILKLTDKSTAKIFLRMVSPVSIDCWKRWANTGPYSVASSFRTLGWNSSGHKALEGFKVQAFEKIAM